MKRETRLLAGLSFLAVASFAFAQDVRSQPPPIPPSDILGPQLIAWSQLKNPQPVSQAPRSDQSTHPDQQPAQSVTSPAPQQPAAQTLTGTIVKDGGQYILKVSANSAYQLDYQDDAQDKVKQYEGKQVKVAGTLDATGKSFHVTSIELIS